MLDPSLFFLFFISLLFSAFTGWFFAMVVMLNSNKEEGFFVCGALEEQDEIFIGGCGQIIEHDEDYRCADCTASFHHNCIRTHFLYPSKENVKPAD